MEAQSWSVVILCFEEKDSIQQVCNDIIEIFKKIKHSDLEIIILDDCSKDGSVEIIKDIELKLKEVKTHFNPINLGIGESTKIAHQLCKNENIYLISADGEANISELLQIKNQIINDGEFYLFERTENPNYGLYRNIISFLNRLNNYLLFGHWIYDIHWNKVIKKEEVNSLNLQLKSGLIDSEIVLKLLKKDVKINKIASSSKIRKFGKSTGGSIKSISKSISELYNLWEIINQH